MQPGPYRLTVHAPGGDFAEEVRIIAGERLDHITVVPDSHKEAKEEDAAP